MTTTLTAAVIGDIHIDASPTGRLPEAEQVCGDIAADGAASVIVIAGDLFQHTRSNAVERNAALRVVRRFADVAPVLILRGNHDGLGELDFLRHLRAAHPVIVEDGYAVHVVAGIAFACAAWPCKASLLARENTTNARAADKALLTAFRTEMARLGVELAQYDGPKMLVAHAMVRGSTTSVGQPLVGCELEVSLDDLALVRAPITVLGHIHKAQEWRGTPTPTDWRLHNFECEGIDGDVLYTGSPRPTDFGDLDDKSYLRVHFGDTDHGDVRPVGWERISTTATPLTVAQATWDGASLVLDGSPADHAGAEVQLRYSFPASDSPRVAPQAATLRAAIESAGAVKVHLAPKKIATVEARAPQVSEARTVADKLGAFWGLHGKPPHPERKLARLDDLNLATAIPKPRPGWMRFRSVAFGGVRPFDGDVSLDLDAIDGRLIAIAGEPGVGKSTLLEAFTAHFPGRSFRTHGSVKSLMAPDADAFLSVTFDCAAGAGLTVKQSFGRDAKRTPCLQILTADGEALRDHDGKVVLPKCGADEYDAWAREHLPHPASYFASTFLAQSDQAAWLDLDASPRKGVLLRVAGVEYLEGLAKAAGDRARAAGGVLATLSGKCDELRRALGLPELHGDPKTPRTGTVLYQTPEERRIAARMAVRGAETDVEVAEHTLAIANAAARLRAQRDDLTAKIEEKGAMRRALTMRMAEQLAIQAKGKAIEAAEGERQVLGWQLEGVDGAIDLLGRERAALDILLTETITLGHGLAKERDAENERRRVRRAEIDRRLAEIETERQGAAEGIGRRRALLAQAASIRAAVEELAPLDAEIRSAKNDAAEKWQAERAAAEPIPRLRKAANFAGHEARAADNEARDRAEWPALVREYLKKKAEHAALLATRSEDRENATAKLDVALHVHERRAKALRGTVDLIIDADNGPWAGGQAQLAADADDALLREAEEAGDVAFLKAEVVRLDNAIADVRGADAAVWLPLDVPRAEEEARLAITQANADRDVAKLRAEQAAAAVTAAEEHFDTAREARIAAEGRHEALRTQRETSAVLAAQAPELASAEERVAELLLAHEKLAAEEAALLAEYATLAPLDQTPEAQAVAARKATLAAAKEATRATLAAAAEQRADLLSRIAEQDAILARRAEVAAAGALLDELRLRSADLATEEAALRVQLADVPLPLDSVPTVEAARTSLDAAQNALATERERHAVVTAHLAALAEREAEREAALADVEDWEHLALALGRNGIQADEVDAIGPRVASLATMFLHECYGTDWTVTEIDTVGTCDAMVAVATEEGDPRSDRTFSPGQRAILSGAVSLAIATIEAQNAGVTGTTLFFDEPSGPLSVTCAVAWVRMIRKAIDIVGADKAIYISHTPEAVKEADVRILVAGGRAVVE